MSNTRQYSNLIKKSITYRLYSGNDSKGESVQPIVDLYFHKRDAQNINDKLLAQIGFNIRNDLLNKETGGFVQVSSTKYSKYFYIDLVENNIYVFQEGNQSTPPVTIKIERVIPQGTVTIHKRDQDSEVYANYPKNDTFYSLYSGTEAKAEHEEQSENENSIKALSDLKSSIVAAIKEGVANYKKENYGGDLSPFKIEYQGKITVHEIDFSNQNLNANIFESKSLIEIAQILSMLLAQIDDTIVPFSYANKYLCVIEQLKKLSNEYIEKLEKGSKEFSFSETATALESKVDDINRKNKAQVIQVVDEDKSTSSIDIKPNEEVISYVAISPKLKLKAQEDLNSILDKVNGIPKDLKEFLQDEIATLDFSGSKASSPKKAVTETKTSFTEKLELIKNNLDDANAYYMYFTDDYKLLQERSSYESLNHMSVSRLDISGISKKALNIDSLICFLKADKSQREQDLAQLKDKYQESTNKRNHARLQYDINDTSGTLLEDLHDGSKLTSVQYDPRAHFDEIRRKGLSSYDSSINYEKLASEYAVLIDGEKGPDFINFKASKINSLASYLDTIKQKNSKLLELFKSRGKNKDNPEQINTAALSGDQELSEFFEKIEEAYSQFLRAESPISVIEEAISALKAAQSSEEIQAIKNLDNIFAKYKAFTNKYNNFVLEYAHKARELELKINNVMPDLVLDLEKEKLLGESNKGIDQDRWYDLYAVTFSHDDSVNLASLEAKLEEQSKKFNSLNQGYEAARSAYLKQEASNIFPLTGVLFDIDEEEIEKSQTIDNQALVDDQVHEEIKWPERDNDNGSNSEFQFDFDEDDQFPPRQANRPADATEVLNETKLPTVTNESSLVSDTVVEVSPKTSYTREEVLAFKHDCDACLRDIHSNLESYKNLKMPFVELNQHRSLVAEDAHEKHNDLLGMVDKLLNQFNACVLYDEVTVDSKEAVLSEAAIAHYQAQLHKADVEDWLSEIKSIVIELNNKNKYLTKEEIDSKNNQVQNLIKLIKEGITKAKIEEVNEKVEKANAHVEARENYLLKLKQQKENLLECKMRLTNLYQNINYNQVKLDGLTRVSYDNIQGYFKDKIDEFVKLELGEIKSKIHNIDSCIQIANDSKNGSHAEMDAKWFEAEDKRTSEDVKNHIEKSDKKLLIHNNEITRLYEFGMDELDQINEFENSIAEFKKELISISREIDGLNPDMLKAVQDGEMGPIADIYYGQYKSDYNVTQASYNNLVEIYDSLKQMKDSAVCDKRDELAQNNHIRDTMDKVSALGSAIKQCKSDLSEFCLNNKIRRPYLHGDMLDSKSNKQQITYQAEKNLFVKKTNDLFDIFDDYISHIKNVNRPLALKLEACKKSFAESNKELNACKIFMTAIESAIKPVSGTQLVQSQDSEKKEGLECIKALQAIKMDDVKSLENICDLTHAWHKPSKPSLWSRAKKSVSNFFHDYGGYMVGAFSILGGIGLALAGAFAVPITGPIGIGLVTAGSVLVASGVGVITANYVGNQPTSNKTPSVNKPKESPNSQQPIGGDKGRPRSKSVPVSNSLHHGKAYFDKPKSSSVPTDVGNNPTPTPTTLVKK